MNPKMQFDDQDVALNSFDVNERFVRVRELRPDGFIEFEFAIGDPELFAEMILDVNDFDAFCSLHKVIFLAEGGHDLASEEDEFHWRLKDATKTRFKSK